MEGVDGGDPVGFVVLVDGTLDAVGTCDTEGRGVTEGKAEGVIVNEGMCDDDGA